MMTPKRTLLLMQVMLAVVWLLPLSSCGDELQDGFVVDENTPLVILAEIGDDEVESPGTRADVSASNAYDRSSFIAGDKINVVCTRAGATIASAGYAIGSDGKWTVADGATGLGFLPAITCRAEFPVNYDGIMTDQSTPGAFLKSNLLATAEVNVSGAEINFTGNNALTHRHARLTLNFEGENTLPAFSQMIVEGTGLRTGDSASERINLLRPVEGEYNWCAVIYPRTAGSTIDVTITDEYGITYKVRLSLASVAANKNYIYKLTLQNNVLVPVGDEIKAWNVKNRYTGGFDN